ncbi:MAG: D-tyrosyl-tRNA(Tyr) deacylase [Acidobacteria bacterium]|nr:D-tyrosyl-tRNA(Tyr) deacylase [Acidobacteriota bacterium]
MRAVVQRVRSAEVRVDHERRSSIGRGLLVFVGVAHADAVEDAKYIAAKVRDLRIFEDDQGKMNRSVMDIGGEALVVSQFTLYGDSRKGRRPSFDAAATPELARTLYEEVVRELRGGGVPVQTGEFRAMMEVELVNDGPVTLLLDSSRTF